MKFKTPILLCAIAIALAGCNNAPKRVDAPPEPTTPITLTPAQLAKLKEAVARGLKDPESARFGEVMVATQDSANIHVCGTVNAKNSYGGYGGSKIFYAAGIKTLNLFTLMILGDTSAGDHVTREACQEHGISTARLS